MYNNLAILLPLIFIMFQLSTIIDMLREKNIKDEKNIKSPLDYSKKNGNNTI